MTAEVAAEAPHTPAGSESVYAGRVVLFTVGLIPLVAYLGNLGFAPITALAGLACFPLLARNRLPSLGMGLLVGLLVWALISTTWSPVLPLKPNFRDYDEVEGLTWLKLILQLPLYGAFVLATMHAPPAIARRAVVVLGVGLAMLVGLLLLEGFAGAPLYQAIKHHVGEPDRPDLAKRNVARACYTLVLMFWPAVLMLWRCRLKWMTIVLAVGALVSPMLLGVDAPIAAFVVSLAIFILVRWAGQAGLYLCMAGVAAYFALAPLAIDAVALVGDRKASWSARQQIWKVVIDGIQAHPLRGWGLDASRVLPKPVSLHPHDGALQIWFELGSIGVALTAVFWVWLLWTLTRVQARDRALAAAGAATIGVYLTIGALSFGVWQEWWLALGALAIGVFSLSNVSSNAYFRKRAAYYV